MMEINVPSSVQTLTVPTNGSLVSSGSIVAVSNLPVLNGDGTATGTTYLNLPILRDGTLITATAIPTSQGLVIATGPDGTGTVFLDPSQVAMLTQAQANLFASADITVTEDTSDLEKQQQHLTTVLEIAEPEKLPEQNTDIRPPVGKGPFKCEICDKVFPKWSQIQRHQRSHADDKPFRCDKCSMSYNLETNLVLHKATHNVDDPSCPECGKHFSRVASLKAHIMLHEKEEYLACNECGDEFSTQNQLDKHMKSHREEEVDSKIYPCRQCTQEFTKASLLREHMKAHYRIKASLSHRTYKRNIDRTSFTHNCETCGKTFQKPSQLERHIRIHTGERPYKCDQCDKAFNQKGALQIHLTKHSGERPHQCEFCPAAFSQKGNLRAHIQRVHTIAKEAGHPIFHCEECTCIFRKLGSLNAHMSRMHSEEANHSENQRAAEDGDDEEEEEDGADNHNEDDDDDTMVNSIEVVTPANQKAVKEVIMQLLERSEKPINSEQREDTHQQDGEGQDDDGTENSDLLQQALENSGLTEGGDRRSIRVARRNNLKKGLMGKSAMTGLTTVADTATGSFKKHTVRKVGGVRWHQCMYCSKEFKKPSDLVRHIRIHTHEKPYKCGQCFRAFAVKSTLTAHIRTHSGLKEFKCHECDKHFSTQGSLKVHLRLHTGAKPFDCPHCDKQFRTSGHRKSHVVSHFKENEPRRPRRITRRVPKNDVQLPDIPLQEPILITDTGYIQQPARNSAVYNQFINATTGVERPYRCSYCPRGFKKSSHLKQHIRSHTGEKPFQCNSCHRSFVSSGVLKAHVRTHTGVKAYKCVLCDTSFTTNGSLKRHMSIHSEIRPFMCPYCQKTFKTSVNCKKHMKTHKHELAMQAAQAASGNEESQAAGDDGEPHLLATTEIAASDQIVDAAQELPTVEQVAEPETHTVTLDHAELQQTIAQDGITIQNTLTQENLQQLQQTLTQEVFGDQASGIGQTITSQQTLTLEQQQAFSQAFEQFSTNGFGLQTDQLQNTLDISGLGGTFAQARSVVEETTMATADMSTILQQRDPETTVEDQQQEMLLVNHHQQDQQENDPVMDVSEGGKRLYRCGYCSKAFKKSSHLKQHIRSHTGEKPYRCQHCSRMFGSSGVLKAHLRTHIGNKDYKCHQCHASFTTNGSLTRHMMIHTSIRPFKCSYCNETFRTAVHCKRHLKIHRGDVNGDSQDRCFRRFRPSVIQLSDEQTIQLAKQTPCNSASVSENILIASAAEKNRISEIKDKHAELAGQPRHPHQCHRCPKSFKKPSDLIRHIRIHTGEKPFVCSTCNKSFTVKSTLDSHVKTHTGEKHFSCHVCQSMFATKGSLKVHMRLHTGAKPFKCPHCDQRFRTSGHRKSHIATHFKPVMMKKRKAATKNDGDEQQQLNVLEQQVVHHHQQQTTPVQMQQTTQTDTSIVNAQQGLTVGQISIDPQLLQQNLVQTLSGLSVTTDSLGGLDTGGQVLQGLEGVQLQLNGLLGQGLQITGLDPGLLTQTIQIDASLLQQLQQQGNVNITINPNILTHQDIQQSATLQADSTNVLNQNIIIQQLSGLSLPLSSHQQLVVPVNPNTVDLQGLQEHNVAGLSAENRNYELSLDAQGNLIGTEAESEVSVLADTSVLASNTQVQLLEDTSAHMHAITNETDVNLNMDLTSGVVGNVEAHSNVQIAQLSQPSHEPGLPFTQAESTQDESGVSDSPASDNLQRTHMCNLCGKGFKRAGHLKEHIQTHTPSSAAKNQKPTPHGCPACDKCFEKPSQLRRHYRIHTGERPFVCLECNKAFNQKNALQIHMKKHTGERPYKCGHCDFAFTQKGNLKVHIKRAHSSVANPSMNFGDAEEEESLQNDPESQSVCIQESEDGQGIDLGEYFAS